MNPKRFFFPESVERVTHITAPEGACVTVHANRPFDPSSEEVFVGISMDFRLADSGEAWAEIDANELRDAINRAVGEREGAKGSDPKPYRPIDRDRLLRHIEDVEAALARRNERWENDQSRIRDLEAEVHTLREIKDSYEEPKTAREYLELAWEAAILPENGVIHRGEKYIFRYEDGDLETRTAAGDRVMHSDRLRLLEPRVEPTEEERRQAIVDEHGLQDWEIELLAASGTN